MIAKGDLQAIVIATPDDLHYPMTMDALDAGLHVLCEKPLARTAAQAREMYERAEAVGVRHMTYFTWRWPPHYRYLKALVESDYTGRVYHANIRYVAGFSRQPDYQSTYDPQLGTGALGNQGSHMIDMARWLLGDVAAVSASVSALVERAGPDGGPMASLNDVATLVLRFESGAQGVIQTSAVAHVGERGQQQVVLLYGESGTLEAEYCLSQGSSIRGARAGEREFRTLSIPEAMLAGIDQTRPSIEQLVPIFTTQPVGDRLFVDAILEGRPVAPSFYEGFKAQQVMDAALRSDAEGRAIAVGG
jgi:predicted dehydrogenase